MTLDDLRRLNPRDIGSWPALPKLGALFILLLLLVFAGYWFDWQNQLETLARDRAKEQDLRTAFLDKKKQAVNLEAYRKQLAEIEESFGEMLKQLPNKSEMEALLTDINQAGLGRGLQFELFRPAPAETRSEFYAELPITIKLAGNYHDIGAFASDISQLSRIVTLNDIALSSSKSGLTLDATAKTFRYLDDSEVAAQRKAARDAAAAKKK
ncbi:MAG TPA: type 4a pilus biogenesis protein PilO [Burkholderiales bacterium]|jgi:type IV pilus assembly protein PilO|nr:type 4a pilus biogenesis protein PilO [Burkholderiales bacterium]